MRLSVHGCLVLGFCLISFNVSASLLAQGNSTFYTSDSSVALDWAEAQALDYLATSSCNDPWYCTYSTSWSPSNGGAWVIGYYTVNQFPLPTCTGGTAWNSETHECETVAVEPSQCFENGQIYDPNTHQCVLDCGGLGQLDGVCLQQAAQNNDTCTSETADYQGSIGFGQTKLNICASQTQCEGGSFGVVNGTPVCIADEYGPPTCPSTGALVIDVYGFVCESLNNVPPSPEVAEQPNTDTDGDGTPDEYQRSNDPESVDKGLDKINLSLSTSNEALDKSNNILGKMNEQNKRMIEELDDVGDGLGSVNTHLQNMQDAMVPPEGGFNPDGFGGLVPTFEETGANFIAAINGMSQVQALTEFVSIGSNNTCPVYTIPATPVSQPIVLDIHCAVFEEYRSTFAAIFLFFWIGLSLFIFFRA